MIIESTDQKTEAAAPKLPTFPEAPPAYGTVTTAEPSVSPAGGSVETGSIIASDNKAPPVATDKIYIARRNKDITGTYHLTPRPKKKFLGISMNEDSEIRFCGRTGNIYLNLSTGSAPNLSDNINVRATSRLGNIFINFTSLSPKSHTSLRAGSRRGHVTVFLPQEYSGSVQLSTVRGKLNVLPGISSLARLEKLTDTTQVMNFGTVASGCGSRDYCKLYSREETVTLGLHGVDSFTPLEKVGDGKEDDDNSDSDSDD